MPAAPPPPARSIAPPSRGGSRSRGFTLAELLVTVVIFGLLVASALPHLLRSVYRARRTEALYALHAIHDFQAVHYATNSEYTDSFAALGFALDNGTQRADGSYKGPFYSYSLARWSVGGRANANYRATATGDLDKDDATLDVVIIENALTVLN